MLPEIYYQSGLDFLSLPEWAYFYLTLGRQIALIDSSETRVVASLAIPTRAYAAALVMSGVVLANPNRQIESNQARIEYILNQKPGTAVHFRRNTGRRVKGKIEGFTQIRGKTHIVIQTAGKDQSYLPLEEYASKITVSETDVTLPEYHQTGYRLESPNSFLECLLGTQNAQEHVLESSFDVFVIGKMSLLRSETCESCFFGESGSSSTDATGSLQDIVRVRQFSGTNQAYKAECVSESNSELQLALGNREPPMVIFDGAVAYLKHQHRWESPNYIILLDRTERQFADAVELVNQNYSHRTGDIEDFSINVPSNIEMMFYKGT